MPPRLKSTSKVLRRLESTSKRLERVESSEFAHAIGATEVQHAAKGQRANPSATSALRLDLYRRLASTGGRPSLQGATRRQKIPLTDEDWRHCEEIAELLANEKVSPTPGQVASGLLHHALGQIDYAALQTAPIEELEEELVTTPGLEKVDLEEATQVNFEDATHAAAEAAQSVPQHIATQYSHLPEDD